MSFYRTDTKHVSSIPADPDSSDHDDPKDRDRDKAPETPPDEPRPPQVEDPPAEAEPRGPYTVGAQQQ
jgi:hypothetical protein